MRLLDRRSGEADSAFRFRYAWFAFKCAVVMGMGLALLLAVRPEVLRSPAPWLVMFLYVGLPLGTATALLAALGFGISGWLARVFDERPGAQAPLAQERPARTPQPRWLWALLCMAWLLCFLIAGYAPDTVLDAPALRAYVNLMAPVANPKGLLGTRSQFPQVTLLYHAVAVWTFPAWLAVWWIAMNNLAGRDAGSILFKPRLSTANRLVLLLLVPFWLALAYAALSLNHGGDARLAAFGSSRVQLAVLGMAFYAGGAAALVAAAFSVKRALREPRRWRGDAG